MTHTATDAPGYHPGEPLPPGATPWKQELTWTSSGRTQHREASSAPPDELDIPSMVPYRFDTPKPKQAPKVVWSPDFDTNTGTAGTGIVADKNSDASGFDKLGNPILRKFDRTTFSELEYNGLMPSKSLMEMQRVANAERRAAVTASRPENLTLRRALADMYDGVIGAWEEVYRSTADSPAGLWAVFSKRNRLRGLGLALAALAVGGLVIESAYD
jgi:hypothetical protein